MPALRARLSRLLLLARTGQTTAEYAVLLALVSLAVVAALTGLAANIDTLLRNIIPRI